MMRMTVAVAAAGALLAGCSKHEGGASNAAIPSPTPAATASPAAGFSPPTSISRAEFGGRIERRFRKLDKNGDGKLSRDELPPKRADRLLRRMDKDGDGALSSAEWSEGMLQRFDKQDTNRDGNLTSDERGKRGGGGGGKRRHRMEQQQQQGGAIDDEGDEVDNGM